MAVHSYDIIHRQHAADLEREARVGSLVLSLRRARRLETAAHLLDVWAGRIDRVAQRLSARARSRRAHVL